MSEPQLLKPLLPITEAASLEELIRANLAALEVRFAADVREAVLRGWPMSDSFQAVRFRNRPIAIEVLKELVAAIDSLGVRVEPEPVVVVTELPAVTVDEPAGADERSAPT